MLSQTDTALNFFTQKEKKLFTYETAFGLTIITEKVFIRYLRGACRPATRHNTVPHRHTPTFAAVFDAAATFLAFALDLDATVTTADVVPGGRLSRRARRMVRGAQQVLQAYH